jgi:hypothetical protein
MEEGHKQKRVKNNKATQETEEGRKMMMVKKD